MKKVHKCKFKQEMITNLKDEIFEELSNYLSLDESECYIMDLVNDALDKLKKELESVRKEENEKIV